MGRRPTLEDALEVVLEGGQRLADGVEDAVAGEALPGVAQEVGDAPTGGLSGLGVADPAESLLDPPGDGGEEVGRFEFGERLGLRRGETAAGALQDGLAQGLGQFAVLGFGATDVIDGLGEQLHDVEPVDGDGGVLEGLADGGEEGTAHVADDLDDAAR